MVSPVNHHQSLEKSLKPLLHENEMQYYQKTSSPFSMQPAMHTVIRLCVVDNHLEAHTPPQLTNTTVLHDSMRVLDIREQTHAQG